MEILVILLSLVAIVESACDLYDPYFTHKPMLEMVSLERVKINWWGMVDNIRCVDQYYVMWNIKGSRKQPSFTNLVNSTTFEIEINVTANQLTEFTVLAREDMGTFGSNVAKSAKVTFLTKLPEDQLWKYREELKESEEKRRDEGRRRMRPLTEKPDMFLIVMYGSAIAVGLLLLILIRIACDACCSPKNYSASENSIEENEIENDAEELNCADSCCCCLVICCVSCLPCCKELFKENEEIELPEVSAPPDVDL